MCHHLKVKQPLTSLTAILHLDMTVYPNTVNKTVWPVLHVKSSVDGFPPRLHSCCDSFSSGDFMSVTGYNSTCSFTFPRL